MSTGPGGERADLCIPGWETAVWTPVGTGSNHRVYRLEQDGRRAILKLASMPRAFPRNRREDEARLQAAAHAAGLAPAVLYADDQCLLEEEIAGRPWSPAQIAAPSCLEALAGVLRRLHGMPPSGHRFPMLDAARRYVDELPADTDRREADRCLAIVAAARPSGPPCPCHNDLVATNVMSPPGPMLIDWEYAGDNDPLFDLATVVTEHGIGAEGRRVLLDAYFGPAGQSKEASLLHWGRVYAALTWLWSAAGQ